jgi:hypothetical protein
MSISSRPLRVVLVWRGEPLEERLFAQATTITVGTHKRDTFTVPPTGVGDRFPLFRPSPDATGFVLTLAPGMSGKLSLDGQAMAVSEYLGGTEERREQPLGIADWGIVALDDSGDVAFFFQFVAPGLKIGRPRSWLDRFLGQALGMSALVHVALLIVAFFIWEPSDSLDVDPPPSTAIAKVLLDSQKPEKAKDARARAEARKVREDDASKRAAGKEGKIGNAEARGETKIPKGPRDQVAARVSQMGLLGTLTKGKQSGALKSLLSDAPDGTITSALAGLKGTQLAIGHGSGGKGTRGEGTGGGGTGAGQLLGVGSLAIGGGGTGARATGSGGGHVTKELKVAVTTGAPSTDGGLSKEQILKVVQSHAAAIQFCYEKELQRFPHLSGKVVIGWKVGLDGRVDGARIDSSSLGNPSAESCMVRQVKAWQFPKPNGVICSVTFPFFFKGQ